MDKIRLPILSVLALYWTVVSLFGLLNADNVFALDFGVGLGYLLFMVLVGGLNGFLALVSIRDRHVDSMFLVFYGILNAFVALGFVILRFAVFPDVYSVVATSLVQVEMLAVLFGFTAVMSLVKNDALSPKEMLSPLPEDDDDPTEIDYARYERFEKMLR